MIAKLETQEAGTGKWFPIVFYHPGTPEQEKAAYETANAMHMLGLRAHVSGFKQEDPL